MKQRQIALLGGMVAGILLVIGSTLPGLASAVAASGTGLRISPVSTNTTMNPGETKVVTVYVQNVTQVTMTVEGVVNDFTASGESGAPALLLNPGDFAPTHSLKRYVAPIGNITLNPQEQKAVNVSITIPRGTSGGGYYGAVRFVPVSTGGTNNVTLTASVASLILVRVPGNFKEQLNLSSFDVRSGADASPRIIFTSGKGLVAAMRFENVGDVQEQPFGKVLLKQGSKILAQYEVNHSDPRGNVLPSSVRLFTVDLTNLGVFGKYTLYGNFGYGTSGQLVSGQTTFYIVPLPAILGVLAVVLVIFFFIFVFPRMKGAYDRGVLARARRR